MKSIQKIVVLGPESTGKSTLCAALAVHYQTIWTPEYARQYLSECKMLQVQMLKSTLTNYDQKIKMFCFA